MACPTVQLFPGHYTSFVPDALVRQRPNDNPPDEFIANLQNSPDGKWLKISAEQNAAITVSNARTGESKTYKRN